MIIQVQRKAQGASSLLTDSNSEVVSLKSSSYALLISHTFPIALVPAYCQRMTSGLADRTQCMVFLFE